MGFNLMTLTLGVIIGSVIAVIWLIWNNVKLNGKETKKANSLGGSSLDTETKQRFLKNLMDVYRTLNLKTIMSTVTENMYYATQASVQVLTKLGLRKEIDIIPNEQLNSYPTANLVMADGKNNMTVDVTNCSYTEKYIDNVTDKVLYQKVLPEAAYVMELIKSDCMERQTDHYCSNCGAPMDIRGDFFNCSHCGTHYATESYNWVVSKTSVENTKKGNLISKLFLIVICAMLVSTLLGQFVGGIYFTAIAIALDVLVAGAVIIYVLVANRALFWIKRMAEIDPQFSRMNFQKRYTYLLKQYYLAKDFQISMIESFMVPELYAKLKEQHQYDDYYLLDIDFLRSEVTNYSIQNGMQVADLKVKVAQVSMNSKKRLRKNKKIITFSVCRDASLSTRIIENTEMIVCDGCGATINLAADGKCKRCGQRYDLSKYDWILYNID